MSADPTLDNARAWERKPALRAIYHDLYRRMASLLAAGPTLEIGGGSGAFKTFAPEVWTTDIGWYPWLDAVADAQRLPFAAGRLANIVLFDVLHHIEFPVLFLREAARVLRPGGRLVACEPAMSTVGRVFYTHFHHEPVDMAADPLAAGTPTPGRDPFLSNQAIPTLLVTRARERLHAAVPALRVARVDWVSLFAYPLSGGYQRWSLVPGAAVPALLAVERALAPALGRLLGFRMLIVLERQDAAQRYSKLP